MTAKDGRYSYSDSLKGANNSAKARSQRAAEPIREIVDYPDGSVTYIHETYELHCMGGYRTLVPLDILDYPIVVEFADRGFRGLSSLLPVEVTGALSEVKRDILRKAQSESIADADGEFVGGVVPADESGKGSFYWRLAWWELFLGERLNEKRNSEKRVICDGESDLGTIVADIGVERSPYKKAVKDGVKLPIDASVDAGFAFVELVDAIESILSGVPEDQAYVFREHFFEDRDYKDIARDLNKACSSMTYLMSKLLPLMRERLKEFGY